MKKVIKISIALLTLAAVFVFYTFNKGPNIDELLENSVLNNRQFSAQIKEIKSNSGLKAYLYSDMSSPIISISFMFSKTGVAYENENIGTANFVASLLGEGTKSLASEKYHEFMKENGIFASFSADYDDVSGNYAFPKEKIDAALPVLQDTIINPEFSEKDIELAKKNMKIAFITQTENEREHFNLIANKLIYKDHVYARNHLGSRKTVEKITADGLREYIAKNFTKENLIIGISGSADEQMAARIVDELFSKLPENGDFRDLAEAEPSFSSLINKEKQDFSQSKIMLTAKGVYRNDKDFYPLYVANYIFGGSGLNSRLNKELRVKRGWTYGAYSGLRIKDASALLLAFFETSDDNFEKASDLALSEWKSFGKKGVKKDEFEKAKKYMLSSFNLRFSSTSDISSMLVEIQKYDLGINFLNERNRFVQEISIKQVQEAAKKYFNENVVLIGIGKHDEK